MRETPELRSRIMRAVKATDTSPEMTVRRLVHAMGYRYRLHREGLPGKPDLVFPRLRKVIFVHGCFWHGHNCPRGARMPVRNKQYWEAKIARNVARDKRELRRLRSLGWKCLVIWECQIRDLQRMRSTILRFLGKDQ
jgi:DNA mismatch endonuclease (patch repair protein)